MNKSKNMMKDPRQKSRPENHFDPILFLDYLRKEEALLYEPAQAIIRRNQRGYSAHTKWSLRKLVGQKHWRQAQFHQREFITKEKKAFTVRPSWPILVNSLDSDVTSHIFSFLDDKSIFTATQVSKTFHALLVPHQRNVSIGGFKSFEALEKWGFEGMEFFSGRGSKLVNDQVLESLATAQQQYPNFAGIEIYECRNVTFGGVNKFIKEMGSRLKRLKLGVFPEKEVKDSIREFETLLSNYNPSLESLSLEINHVWCENFHLYDCLDNDPSLRKLSLLLCNPISLPSHLPNLEILQLDLHDGYAEVYWTMILERLHYPKLKRLEVTLTSKAIKPLELRLDILISALTIGKLPALESLMIRRVKKPFFTKGLVPERNVRRGRYRKHEVESEEWRYLRAFTKLTNIKLLTR